VAERIKAKESILELLLGSLINFIDDNEKHKRYVVLTTLRGIESDWPRTNDTLMHYVVKIALKTDIRIEVVDLSMALLRSMGKLSFPKDHSPGG